MDDRRQDRPSPRTTRIIDEHPSDAAATPLRTAAAWPQIDRGWVRTHAAASLAGIEKRTTRIVALREASNVAQAAVRLGMAHRSANGSAGDGSRWASRKALRHDGSQPSLAETISRIATRCSDTSMESEVVWFSEIWI
jgi:hypothetical protein